MKSFLYLIRLHAVRWYRYSRELGFIRSLLVLLLVFMAIRFVFVQFNSGQYWFGLVIIPILQVIQVGRKDHSFLGAVGLNGRWLYTGFYLTLSAPILVSYLWHWQWVYALLLFAFCFLIPFTRSYWLKPDTFFISAGDFLPYENFEWRTGLRQYGLAVVVLLLIGIGLSFFVATVPLVIIFLTLNTSVFYLSGESKELLVVLSDSPRALIWRKVKLHFATFYIMLSPMVLLFLFFHLDYWYVLVAALFISAVVNINAIIFKYAFYVPGARFDNSTVLQAVSLVSFLVPFLAPLPIILSFINYRKAISRLSEYY